MCPDCGSRRPAMTSSSEVLPAPEGPKSAVERAVISTETSSAKCASGRTRSRTMRLMRFAQHCLGNPHRGEGEDNGDGQEPKRVGVVSELDVVVDRERERTRATGDVPRDEDRRAELPDGAREREKHPADDAACRQRQRDREEDARVAGAEGARDLLE